VLKAPCFVLSDAHLGFAPTDVERAVIGFLRHAADHAASVVINGDLFEFWFEWKSVIPRRGFRVLAALADLTERGIPVLMIAGNHDCWGGDVLRRDAGVDYRYGPWIGDLAGWRTRIEHGDGLRPREDRKYRLIRHVLRNRLAIGAFRWLHPDLATPLATHSSRASRSYGARDGGRGLREAAERAAASDRSLELIIYGHSHVATLTRLTNGVAYANPGSWLDAPTYLRVSPDRIVLARWSDGSGSSTERADLDSLDRIPEKALPKL
jgi:UDP-2,3-diacylglucosamine hydrolase